MTHETAARLAPAQEGRVVSNLAQFFPGAAPVRIPVTVTCEGGTHERTTVEFGTGEAVLFASRLPLEFADRVRIATEDGVLQAHACVVAVHLENGHTAVAARFTERVPNWIVRS